MIIAVDFDGTLCKSAWPQIGEEVPGAISTLKKIRSDFDAQLVLWTCRMGATLNEAVNWCKNRGLEFDAINSNLRDTNIGTEFEYGKPKIFATFYIDDRSIGWQALGVTDKERWERIYSIVSAYDGSYP